MRTVCGMLSRMQRVSSSRAGSTGSAANAASGQHAMAKRNRRMNSSPEEWGLDYPSEPADVPVRADAAQRVQLLAPAARRLAGAVAPVRARVPQRRAEALGAAGVDQLLQ